MGKKKRKNNNYVTRLQTAIQSSNCVTYTPGPVRSLTPYDRAEIAQTLKFNNEQTSRVANLYTRYPGLTFQDILNGLEKLNFQYNAALAEHHRAILPPDLLKMDMIDLTSLSPDELDNIATKDVRDYFQKNPDNQFFNIIPCFSKGCVMHVPKRIIYYELLDIDLEKHRIKLFLQDYVRPSENAPDVYIAGVYGTCNITLLPGKEINQLYDQKCQLEILQQADFPEIYRMISPKQLGWNELDKAIWQNIVIANSDNIAKRQAEADISPVANLFRLFATYISVANYIMACHRTKIVEAKAQQNQESEPQPSKSDKNPDRKTTAQDRPLPERITRHIGKIRIISTTKPQRACKSTIKHYRLESWERRGHVRHYKNGKTAYIKPSVMHRKNLKNPDKNLKQPATTLKVHNELK